MAIILAGELGASATLDAKLQSDDASGFASASDISGKSITQLTKAGSDDDKQAIISLKSEELPAGERYVRLSMTIGTAASDCGAVVLGRGRYKPSTDDDLASVDEIVA
jgi:hypothetical protein